MATRIDFEENSFYRVTCLPPVEPEGTGFTIPDNRLLNLSCDNGKTWARVEDKSHISDSSQKAIVKDQAGKFIGQSKREKPPLVVRMLHGATITYLGPTRRS